MYLPSTPANLSSKVQNAISLRLNTKNVTLIGDELLALRLQAYTTLIASLGACAAFWDGLNQCKVALKLYPGDARIVALKCQLEDGFRVATESLPKGISAEGRACSLRLGKIYSRVYPWLDSSLYQRTPKLVRDVNAEMHNSSNIEVRRTFFGPTAAEDAKRVVGENEDVGHLGIFAKRDIQQGELLLVDKSITGTSKVNPSTGKCCDACHAHLYPPYFHSNQLVRPACCKTSGITYCGQLCHDTAIEAYHTVLCGEDFNWLWKDVNKDRKEDSADKKVWRRWRAVAFLRIIAIIISTNSKLLREGKELIHPLAHSLVARMTGTYTPRTLHPKYLHDWQYSEEVTIPTKILQQLGIDIFTSSLYTQEVIQTIYYRIDNNANDLSTYLNQADPSEEIHIFGINTTYLFFNHSCTPNVNWHGSPEVGTVDIQFLRGIDGEMLRPGESAVWCSAARDIAMGEECFISYIGDPLGEKEGSGDEREDRAVKRVMLGKWCEGGCGCRICEAENESQMGEAPLAKKSVEVVVSDDAVVEEAVHG